MPLARIKPKGQVTIPAGIRGEVGLDEGDYVEVTREGSRIVLTPKQVVDRHPALDAALAEALADERAGRVSPKFRSVEEYEKWRSTAEGRKFAAKR